MDQSIRLPVAVPPGAGKTTLARQIPTDREDLLAVVKKLAAEGCVGCQMLTSIRIGSFVIRAGRLFHRQQPDFILP